ncbi:MAG: 2,3-bisphosphoglycerate-independent phosphoglycerate mutase, partial [bacterium]
MRKALVFILDGLGDRPCAQLRDRTPLQAAKTPTLDRLARDHQCGMMDPLRPGLPVDTHTGTGILFGLAPRAAINLRRGPIEAADIDLEMRHGDILLRANFACVEARGDDTDDDTSGARILDRRAGRISAEAATLCAALQDIEVGGDVIASVHPATQHRAVLRLRGGDLSARISDTDPGGSGVERGILVSSPDVGGESEEQAAARAGADALNAFTARARTILQ